MTVLLRRISTMRWRRSAGALALTVVLGLLPAPQASTAESGGTESGGTCGSETEHPAGEWPSYGRDLANTRSQPAETVLAPGNVRELEPAWSLSTADHGGGDFNNTPIIAGGCAYLAANSGQIQAVDADTGDLRWSQQVDIEPPGFGGGIVGSPAVHDDLLLVIVNRVGSPYIVAFEQATGEQVWKTVFNDEGFSNASVVVHDGLVFAGHSGDREWQSRSQGGFAILAADSGDILTTTPTISDEDFHEHGYRGASIWSTAAVDTDRGYAYAGTSNPHSPGQQHPRTNSLLKIDLDPERDTFGEIVASYRGQSDQYVDGLDRQPACEHFGEDITYPYGSVTCLELDLDFGASPNLFTDDRGATIVGSLQKSGVYHAVDTDGMTRSWTAVLGAPCFSCNAASPATDGSSIYAAAVPPGQMVSLEQQDGTPRWVAPIGGGLHYNSVSTANGVVYAADGLGFLNMYDAATGLLLDKRPIALDVGANTATALSSSGVAIARNTVYVAVGEHVVAYRLP